MLAGSSGTAALSPLVIAAVVGIVVAAVVSVVAAVPRVHPVQENAKDPALDRVDLLGRAPRRLRRCLTPAHDQDDSVHLGGEGHLVRDGETGRRTADAEFEDAR